ncbi:MAG: Holliday junction resolvase RuvX [Bacilli bacterium]|nr:Holliday junction resolvase RuvX [Bacilli bacterium]
MKYLGLDLGTRTLGIAISDATHLVATPLTVLRFPDSAYEDTIKPLKEIIDREHIEKLVLGLPKNMNNTIGDRANTTLEYKKVLEDNFNLPVIMQDERLSTVAAHNYMLEADLSRKKRKAKVDGLAASIILQTYLDIERGNKNE